MLLQRIHTGWLWMIIGTVGENMPAAIKFMPRKPVFGITHFYLITGQPQGRWGPFCLLCNFQAHSLLKNHLKLSKPKTLAHLKQSYFQIKEQRNAILLLCEGEETLYSLGSEILQRLPLQS